MFWKILSQKKKKSISMNQYKKSVSFATSIDQNIVVQVRTYL